MFLSFSFHPGRFKARGKSLEKKGFYSKGGWISARSLICSRLLFLQSKHSFRSVIGVPCSPQLSVRSPHSGGRGRGGERGGAGLYWGFIRSKRVQPQGDNVIQVLWSASWILPRWGVNWAPESETQSGSDASGRPWSGNMVSKNRFRHGPVKSICLRNSRFWFDLKIAFPEMR